MSKDIPAPAPLARVAKISFQCAPLPGGPNVAGIGAVDTDKPHTVLDGFSIAVRGGVVFLISPPGWGLGISVHERKPDGPRRVFEIPRTQVLIQWETDDASAIDKAMQRADTPPMYRVREAEEVPVALPEVA